MANRSKYKLCECLSLVHYSTDGKFRAIQYLLLIICKNINTVHEFMAESLRGHEACVIVNTLSKIFANSCWFSQRVKRPGCWRAAAGGAIVC